MNSRDGLSRATPKEYWVAVGIALAAVALRLVRLGSLSLAGDEETTALATRALLEGWPPSLPGGLVYVRALPFTVLEAAAMGVAGAGESALRLVPALAAAPRVLATWWLGRAFLGSGLALAVAALLAVAPLDVEFSRTARMYSLFAALDVAFLATVIHFTRGAAGGKLLGAGALAGVLGMFTHSLMITHAPVPWAGALGRGLSGGRRLALVATGLCLILAYWLDQQIWSHYWDANQAASHGEQAIPIRHLGSLAAAAATPVGLAAIVAAGLAAAAGCARTLRRLGTGWGRVAAIASALCFALASPILGSFALVGVLILERIEPLRSWDRLGALLVRAAAATAAWGAVALLSGAGGPRAVAEMLLSFPAPNWVDLARAAPWLFALALLGVLAAAHHAAHSRHETAWLGLVVAFAGALLMMGLHSRRDGLRFHLHVLAPMLVLALLGAEVLVAALRVRSRRLAAGLAAAIVLVALRPDYTLEALLREHGPNDSPYVRLDVAPDHRGPGRYVRRQAAPGEWIAAEDALQQQWWAGRVDVWLRREGDAAAYLRHASIDGPARDVYTGALHAGDLDSLNELASAQGREVVWLITSGETEVHSDYYRLPAVDAALKAWEPNAWFVGEDGLTRVYRLERGRPSPPPARAAAP